MSAFLLEIYLTTIILSQLLFNAKFINTLKKNFPLGDTDACIQTCFILLLCVFLIYNTSSIITFNTGNLFIVTNTIITLKLIIMCFALLLSAIIFLAFSIQNLNFFEFFTLY